MDEIMENNNNDEIINNNELINNNEIENNNKGEAMSYSESMNNNEIENNNYGEVMNNNESMNNNELENNNYGEAMNNNESMNNNEMENNNYGEAMKKDYSVNNNEMENNNYGEAMNNNESINNNEIENNNNGETINNDVSMNNNEIENNNNGESMNNNGAINNNEVKNGDGVSDVSEMDFDEPTISAEEYEVIKTELRVFVDDLTELPMPILEERSAEFVNYFKPYSENEILSEYLAEIMFRTALVFEKDVFYYHRALKMIKIVYMFKIVEYSSLHLRVKMQQLLEEAEETGSISRLELVKFVAHLIRATAHNDHYFEVMLNIINELFKSRTYRDVEHVILVLEMTRSAWQIDYLPSINDIINTLCGLPFEFRRIKDFNYLIAKTQRYFDEANETVEYKGLLLKKRTFTR